MSRSGYCDDLDQLSLGRWRGVVASATRGRRGQALLRALLVALDAMPVKELIAHQLAAEGEVCALGALGREQGMNLGELDPDDYDAVATAFGIAPPLAREIVWVNDEAGPWRGETPAERWVRVRAWVAAQVREP